MRRTRKDDTKVWHNPEIVAPVRRRGVPLEDATERRDQRQHRAALEALFAPKKGAEPAPVAAQDGEAGPAPEAARARRRSAEEARIATAPAEVDPKAAERQRLLSRLLCAEGRPRITKATNDFLHAGFTLPDEQDVHLQLLEHSDEARVCVAIDALSALVAVEPPKRKAILESRLKRIEEYADDPTTRSAAARLRRQVTGRSDAPQARGAGAR
jgi:hypothetical protein